MISHDRRFLANLSRSTVWLDRGQTRRIERGFSSFEAWRDEVLAEEERDQHKLDRKIVAEEHWLRYGVSARRKRNVQAARQSACVARGAAHLSRRVGQAQSLRRLRRTIPASWSSKPGTSANPTRDGRSSRGFSTRIQRGDRVGIVGPNGSGKTTLANLLTGTLAPDSGSVRLGANLAIATLDQHRDSLDPNVTLADALTGGRGDHVQVGEQTRHVIGYMKDFLFQPEQARTPLSRLSGGERGRLMLAKALAKPSNVLVLDEPTNDLDLETLDVLEEMLGDYAGTDPAHQPRSRFSRSAGQRGDRAGRRRPLDRIRRRLFRHAGPARRGPRAAKRSKMSRKSARPASPSAAAPERKRRLSFNEKHALETLPATMAALQSKIQALHRRLDEPELYARDRKAFDEASAALVAAQAELAAAEEKWLELEILREEIAAQ